MIDLGQASARPVDRQRAAIVSVLLLVPAVVSIPLLDRVVGRSYPVFAIVVSVATIFVALAALLLWTQARVTRSGSLLVLSAVYAATAAVMTPYLLLYHGMLPALDTFVSTDPQTSSWLWFEWHLLFAASPLIYVLARRSLPALDDHSFPRFERTLGIVAIVLVVAIAPPVIWFDGLPEFSHGTTRTLLTPLSFGTVTLVALASIAALTIIARLRSVIDVWLAVATLCLIVDVLVAWFGAGALSIGWYVSRGYMFVASGTVLTVLLMQTAYVYAQLAKSADRWLDESLTDALTGLANRRCFDARLAQVTADAARLGKPAALLMIDVDQFKAYNDRYGHPSGDRALQAVAAAVADNVSRASDVAARFGGEEIAVVMPATDAAGALFIAERIRAAVANLALPGGEAERAFVTVSIGVAARADAVGCTPERLLEEADRALYAAKRAGRNRVQAFVPSEAAATG